VPNLRAIEAEARSRLAPGVYDYFAGGACDEITLRSNEAALARIGLVPRVLRGVGTPTLGMELLGSRSSMPVLIAPTAFHRLAHAQGECATAEAAAKAGVIMILSMASTCAIEDVAAVTADKETSGVPTLWFQLYLQSDLAFTESVIRRAEAAGCRALVVTVDSPTRGRCEREQRHRFFDLPPGMCCENMREPAGVESGGRVRSIEFAPELSWEHIAWLRSVTKLPIVLKGLMHPADARLAVEHGASALIVSNHGGRQLDTVPASIELLPSIVDAVAGAVPLIVDGGIRRGTDVVKALALGADAVALGRPVLYGLAVAGAQGVVDLLETLRAEVANAFALCGARSVADLGPDLLRLPRTEVA